MNRILHVAFNFSVRHYTMDDGFDVGVDYGTSVDESMYQSPFTFTPPAALQKVG
jgi:hypothetical protein